MKTATDALKNHLKNSRVFHSCDLYELKLLSGESYRYADYDMNVGVGGKLYPCGKRPLFKRGAIKNSSSIQVDKVSVTWTVDESDIVGGLPILRAAHAGMLDDGTLEILRCYMSAPGVVIATVSLFCGEIYVRDGGGLELKLDVKSAAQRFKSTFPRNRYYPNCPWTLYGAGCGLVQAAWAAVGTVTGGSNREILTGLSFPAGYYAQGTLQWLTGANAGTTSSIKSSPAGRLNLLVAPEEAVSAGDTFRVYPGCDKSVATCRNKFNNWLNNRATPYVPLKETLI